MKKFLFFLFVAVVFVIGLRFSNVGKVVNATADSNFNLLLEQLYGITAQEVKSSPYIKLITINYEGDIGTFFTNKPSPVLALVDLNYPLSNKNILISTSPINSLYNNTFINVQSYTSTIDELTLEIPFTSEIKGSVLCSKLERKEIEQTGVLGLMSQKIKRTYKGEELIAEEIIEQTTLREPRPQIVIIKGPNDTPDSVPQRGYNCPYWEAYIDNISASEEEKQWLKFTMRLESGCNAESNKAFYKGLFQWDPCLWYSLYPNDNIFDGEKQIQRTIEKVRAGANPKKMWPAVYKKYVEQYGELSWLQ
ncbi:MAG: hypothetical protein ACOX6Q_01190 [Candidatus Dojkabacteria bacterium]